MSENRKVPKIRFKGFTDDWEQRKAKELCSISTGKSNTQDQAENGLYPFYIRSDIPVRSNRYLYDEEAVITIGDGNIGKVFHYVNGKFDLHQRCYKMDNFKDIEGKYFYYFFSTKFYDRAMSMTAKATVDSVRLEMISDMNINYPLDIKEQRKIGSILTNLDNLITLHQSKLDKLQNIKKSLLDKMFPKNDAKIPEIRFKGFTDDWEQREFNQFAKYRNGKAHENDICDDGKYIVINSKFCSTDGEVKKYSNKQNEPLYKNDIAFVLSDVPNGRALARTFLVEKDDKYTLNQRIAGITPLDNTDPYYLYIMMNRNKYFLQFDDGAKQTNLSTTDVFKFEEMFPNKIEQENIGNIFKQIDNLITLHQSKLDKLQNIKKSLLEKMFV